MGSWEWFAVGFLIGSVYATVVGVLVVRSR